MTNHHFIIKYDSKTKEWDWDVETENAVFPDGAIYYNEKFIKPLYNPSVENLDNELSDKVGYAVRKLNQLEKGNIKWD